MREIKFRAWDGKEMITDIFIAGNGYVSKWKEINLPPFVDYEKFDGEVMQYTGLKENANDNTELNKDIYEGDIIEFLNGDRFSVEWNDDTCQFQFSDGSPINNGERYATYKKIVGNIYKNKNLLT